MEQKNTSVFNQGVHPLVHQKTPHLWNLFNQPCKWLHGKHRFDGFVYQAKAYENNKLKNFYLHIQSESNK